jgi:hypothetical protein
MNAFARNVPMVVPVLVLVVCSMAWPALAQQSTMLRWNWAPGQVLRYHMNQEMKQTMTGIEDKEVSWTVQYVVRQEVKSVTEEGLATVEQTYESGIVTAVERPGERAKYDSTNHRDADQAGHRLIAPYAAFIGKTITFDVGPEGEVPRLTGASAIMDDAMSKMQTDPMTAMLIGQFRESLGDEAMRRQLELALRVVPDRKCRSGDKWEVSLDQSMPVVGTIRNEIVYKVRRFSGKAGAKVASIGATGKLVQLAGAGGGEAGGLGAMLGGLIDIKLTRSKIEGDVDFDAQAGRIDESSYSIDSEWTIGVKGLGGDGEEPLPGEMGAMKGTQKIEQRARLELIR